MRRGWNFVVIFNSPFLLMIQETIFLNIFSWNIGRLKYRFLIEIFDRFVTHIQKSTSPAHLCWRWRQTWKPRKLELIFANCKLYENIFTIANLNIFARSENISEIVTNSLSVTLIILIKSLWSFWSIPARKLSCLRRSKHIWWFLIDWWSNSHFSAIVLNPQMYESLTSSKQTKLPNSMKFERKIFSS